ncbi:hypothetical protein [Phenylobacterium sp.]|jgi:hypothetical protein|uniref:hypothetical protein n=1 Tax=Phenylobacterium sp. TaxID=1871053 RepID=UPI002ED961DD
MSDDSQPGVTRQDLPDEMPRSTTSDDTFRNATPAGQRVPAAVWLLVAVLVALVFAIAAALMGPPTPGIGRSPADVVVPAAPPVRDR